MANQDAWDTGWARGLKNRKKDKGDGSEKSKDSSPSSPDVDATAQKGAGRKNPWSILSYIPHFKKGGRVRKTGLALLHKGEFVVPTKQHRSTKRVSRKRTITKH